MSIRTYYHVNIKDNEFTVHETSVKSVGAVETLQNIEKIVKQNLSCSWVSCSAFTRLSKAQQRLQLKAIAQKIQEGFIDKVGFFKKNAKADQVKTLCQAIENLVSLFALLPYEAMFKLCCLVGEKTLSQLNRAGREFVHQFLIDTAKTLTNSFYDLDLSTTHQYFCTLHQEVIKTKNEGFFSERLVSWQNVINGLKLHNHKRESLIHYLAEQNCPQLLELVVNHHPSPIDFNRKIFGKTPIMIAEEYGHQKVIEILKKSVQQLNKHPPFSILCEEIILNIFKFLNESELCKLSLVSKKFNKISTDNSLWKEIYINYFPTIENKIQKHLQDNLKDKLRCYVENMSNGNYVEEVISATVSRLPGYKVKILTSLLTHDLKTLSKALDLIKEQTSLPQFASQFGLPSHAINTLGNLFASIFRNQNAVRLLELTFPYQSIDISFPDDVSVVFEGHDRIFVRTASSIYTVGRNAAGALDPSPKIAVPHPADCFAKNWNEWLVLKEDSKIIVRKRNNNDYCYSHYQELEIEPFKITINFPLNFSFFRSLRGSQFMLQEVVNTENNSSIICWKHDEKERAWKTVQNFPNSKLLTHNSEYLFTSGLPNKIEDKGVSLVEDLKLRRSYKVSRDIYVWKHTEEEYIKINCFKDGLGYGLKIGCEENILNEEWQNTIAEHWNTFSYSSTGRHLFVSYSLGDLFILEGSYKPKKVSIYKGSSQELAKIYHSAFLFTKLDFPKVDKTETLLGFTQEKYLVSLDKLRGIIIRRFDVTKSEVLKNLSDELPKCPVTNFRSEREFIDFYYIHSRYNKIDYETREKISELHRKIFPFPSLFPDKYRAAGMLDLYLQQLEFGFEEIGNKLALDEWELLKNAIEGVEASPQILKDNIDTITERSSKNDSLSLCKISRLYLQMGDKQQAMQTLQIALKEPDVVQLYLEGFWSNIQKIKRIHQRLCKHKNSDIINVLDRIYKCYTQAEILLEKIKELINNLL